MALNIESSLQKVGKFFDVLCTPPYFYRNLSIKSQNSSLRFDISRGKNPVKNCVLLLRNYYFIVMSFLLTPIAGFLSFLRIRFFMVDLRQIGSVLWLDLHLRELQLSGKQHRRLFVIRSKTTDANSALIELYQEHVTFIAHPLLKGLLGPLFINPWFNVNGLHHEAAYERSDTLKSLRCYAHSTCIRYVERFNQPLVRLPSLQVQEYRQLLANYINLDRPFVLVHVRDSGYYGDLHRQLRNADIRTYEKAFQLLIKHGFSVVRLGDQKMVKTNGLQRRLGPHFFDYAHSEIRSDVLDIYLASECNFFIGCASGPELLPIIFNKSACAINYYNAANCLGFRNGDLSSFKKIRDLKSGKLVPFEKLVVPPLSENLSKSELDKLGLVLEDNTEDEILQTIKEFLEQTDQTPTKFQKDAKARVPQHRRSFGSPGNFSNVILKEYFSTE